MPPWREAVIASARVSGRSFSKEGVCRALINQHRPVKAPPPHQQAGIMRRPGRLIRAKVGLELADGPSRWPPGCRSARRPRRMAKRPGKLMAIVRAPCPPIEWPVIDLRLFGQREGVEQKARKLVRHIVPHAEMRAPKVFASH
jgi:hypothetical protein